jgi:hypothetical protein
MTANRRRTARNDGQRPALITTIRHGHSIVIFRGERCRSSATDSRGRELAQPTPGTTTHRRSATSAASSPEEIVERCVTCHYYDRHNGKLSDGKAQNAGQCRKTAPQLNPINAKSYMIEGVWPTVRDDDWCGEWKALVRRVDPNRVSDVLGATATPRPTVVDGQPRATVISATPMQPPARPISAISGGSSPGASAAPRFAFAPSRGD